MLIPSLPSIHASSWQRVQRAYRQDQLVLVLPRDHALAGHSSVAFEQIVSYDLVGTNHGSAILRQLTDTAKAQGHSLRINIHATSFEAIMSLIDAGHGISVLPRAAVAKSLAGRNPTLIPITDK
jgi:DNA-binding transcriptional LysR family regulator